ncbi:MAG: phosphatase PAP2 family protein [Candidatus Kapabacteria bacterium]|nr:phosphatase PAP2 family protein [Candidatus Kapabacteria bacterium]
MRILIVLVITLSTGVSISYGQHTTPVCSSSALGWDAVLTYDLNQVQSTKQLSKYVSNALYPIGAGAPLAFYFSGLATKSRYDAETGIVLGVVELATFATVVGMKQLIARDRPYIAYPNCIEGGEDDPLKSMPSGHAAASVAISTFISLRYPKWYVIAPLAAYTGYTLYARMNLGMHYPTDLIIGAIIGGGFAYLGHRLTQSITPAFETFMPSAMVSPQGTPILHVSYNFNLSPL